MDVKTLIEEVLTDLGNNKSLIDVSSKIQIIVRLLGDVKFRTWYNHEFVTGYDNEDIPDYRVTRAADIKASYIVPQGFGVWHMPDQSVPMFNLGKEKYDEVMVIKLKENVSSIIEYSKHPEKMAMSLSPYDTALVQKVLGEAHIISVHKVIPPSTFQTIIDNVQNRIIEMFMDLNEKVFDGELDMKSSRTQREIQQVINNNITAGIYQAGAGIIDAKNSTIAGRMGSLPTVEVVQKLNMLIEKIEALVENENNEEIKEELADIKTELSTETPRFDYVKKSFKALFWGASISTKTAIEELVKKALELLL